MTELSDDKALLDAMMSGAERKDPLWQPTAYWRGYCERILRELNASGLAGVRTNQAILKGFAAGGVLQPTQPAEAWKRAVWHGLSRLPGVRRIIAEHRRTARAEHQQHVAAQGRLARLLIERMVDEFPGLAPPAGLANGGAEDAFEWRGHTVTADWLLFLIRTAGFYRTVPASEVRSLLEVGPGLGLSTLAHIALNPTLRVVVNVDIPPVLYISTQYLRSIDGVTIVDVRDIAESDRFEPLSQGPGVTIYQIAPWQLPRLHGSIDLFHNAYSFQEMEREVCVAYAELVRTIVSGHVWLLSRVEGHRPGAGGQIAPIPLQFLADLFRDSFPIERQIDNELLSLYGDPEQQLLLSNKGRS